MALTQYSEQLLSRLLSEVSSLCPEIEIEGLRCKLSSVLQQYEIRPLSYNDKNSDLQEKIDFFISSKKLEGLSPITLQGYALELGIFAKYVKKRAEDISTADIRVFLGQFPHLKLSSISKRLSVLKSFFGWLTEEEIIPRDPSRKVKPPKTEKRLPKALSIEELEMLREGCKTYRQRALIECLYATGCRLSEVYNMDRDSINYQNGSARIVGKGNKEREVYFSYKAIYHLKKYLNTRKDNDQALFVTERQPYRRLSRRSIQREIAKIAKIAGLKKKVSPHSLRHTFATLTLNNGADLAAVQALLGHSKPDTTMIYAQLTNERKRDQYRRYLVQ